MIHRYSDERDVDLMNYFNPDVDGDTISNEFKTASCIYIASA